MSNLAIAAIFTVLTFSPAIARASDENLSSKKKSTTSTPPVVASHPKADAKSKPMDSKPRIGDAKKKTATQEQKTVVLFSDDKSKVTLVYDHALPNVPGKSMKGSLVEYKPGGSTPCHTHPKSAFIYATVLEGAITSQVNDGPTVTYTAGQNFSENPGDKHGISRNASKTKPAKLLAVFVVDSNETELTTMCSE